MVLNRPPTQRAIANSRLWIMWSDRRANDPDERHVGRWQGENARYRGQRKNLFDLRRMAIVHNLHVIARTPAHSQPQAA